MRPSSADTRPVPAVRIRLANAAPRSRRPGATSSTGWSRRGGRDRTSRLQRAVELARELATAAGRLRAAAGRLRLGERPPPRLRPAGHGRQRQGLRPHAGALLPVRRDRGRGGQWPAGDAGGRCRRGRHRRCPVLFPAADGRGRGRPPRRPRRGRRRQRRPPAARRRPRFPDGLLVSRATCRRSCAATSTTSRSPIRWPASGCRRRPALDGDAGALAPGPDGAADGRRVGARAPADRSPRRARWRREAAPRPGRARLAAFVARDLATYADDRDDPDDRRAPAACRRTSTSATCRRTRCSTR